MWGNDEGGDRNQGEKGESSRKGETTEKTCQKRQERGGRHCHRGFVKLGKG